MYDWRRPMKKLLKRIVNIEIDGKYPDTYLAELDRQCYAIAFIGSFIFLFAWLPYFRPTVPASKIDGVLLDHAYLHFECELDRIIDGFGKNSLIVGKIVAAAAAADSLRDQERDAQEMIAHSPMLAYLHPGRFAEIVHTNAFPYHVGFKR